MTMITKSYIHHIAAVAITIFISGSQALAFDFSPIYATLTTKGKSKSFTFSAFNNGKEKIAIQINIFQRTHNLDGVEQNIPADDQFSIYPGQMLLKPNETKRVRVTWLGAETIPQEFAFRLIANQLPVDGLAKVAKNQKGGEIKVLMKYITSLYVIPEKADSNVVVNLAEITPKQLHLILENKGLKHRVLTEPKLKVIFKSNGEDKTAQIEGSVLDPMKDKNILPGDKMQFFIPWDQPAPEGPVKVELSLKDLE